MWHCEYICSWTLQSGFHLEEFLQPSDTQVPQYILYWTKVAYTILTDLSSIKIHNWINLHSWASLCIALTPSQCYTYWAASISSNSWVSSVLILGADHSNIMNALVTNYISMEIAQRTGKFDRYEVHIRAHRHSTIPTHCLPHRHTMPTHCLPHRHTVSTQRHSAHAYQYMYHTSTIPTWRPRTILNWKLNYLMRRKVTGRTSQPNKCSPSTATATIHVHTHNRTTAQGQCN